MKSQTSTTIPSVRLTIRGEPTLLTSSMVCVVSLPSLQICVCFLNAMLCVWAVQKTPQHTMETRALPRWVLFILLYFLFQSPGKKSSTGLCVIIGMCCQIVLSLYICQSCLREGFFWGEGGGGGYSGVQSSRVTLSLIRSCSNILPVHPSCGFFLSNLNMGLL